MRNLRCIDDSLTGCAGVLLILARCAVARGPAGAPACAGDVWLGGARSDAALVGDAVPAVHAVEALRVKSVCRTAPAPVLAPSTTPLTTPISAHFPAPDAAALDIASGTAFFAGSRDVYGLGLRQFIELYGYRDRLPLR